MAKGSTELLKAAEEHLSTEEHEQAMSEASQALAGFRAKGDEAGMADAQRTIINVMCCQGKFTEAHALAKTELERIQGLTDKTGEAKMLLAFAEVNDQTHGEVNCATALANGVKAQEAFKAAGDKKMEGLACLAIANIHLRKKGESKTCAEDALEAANTARDRFKELDDKRNLAAALHTTAAAHVQAKSAGKEIEAGAWLVAAQGAAQIFQEQGLRKLLAWEKVCIAQWTLLDNPRRALRLAEEAMGLSCEAGSSQEAVALGLVVKCHLEIKDTSQAWQRKAASEAVKVAKDGVKRFRAKGDKSGEGQALMSLTLAYLHKGEHQQGLKTAEQAAKVCEELNDTSNQALMLQVIAQLHLKLNSTSKAMSVVSQAHSVSAGFANRFLAMEGVYEVHLRKNDIRSAIAVAQQIESLAQDAGEPKSVAVAKLLQSNAHAMNQDYQEAIMVAREAQAMFSDLDAAMEEAESLRLIAEAHVANRDYEAGVRAAGKATKLLRAVGNLEGTAAAAFLVAQTRLLQLVMSHGEIPSPESNPGFAEECAEAMNAADEALAMARKLGNAKLVASVLCTVAQIQVACFNTDSTFETVEEAMGIFRAADDQASVAAVLCIEADAHLLSGNINKALAVVNKALTMFREQGDTRGEAVALAIVENITGPEEDEIVEEQFDESQWQQYQMEQWQAQQDAIQQQQQQEPGGPGPEQALVKQKRAPRELTGAKLDQSNLSQDIVQRRLMDIVKSTVDVEEDEEFEMDKPLMQMGITSKSAVVLRNVLSEELPGVPLPFTLVFDYPSVSMMTDLIMESQSTVPKRRIK